MVTTDVKRLTTVIVKSSHSHEGSERAKQRLDAARFSCWGS